MIYKWIQVAWILQFWGIVFLWSLKVHPANPAAPPLQTYRTHANKGRGFYSKITFITYLRTMVHFTQNCSLAYSKNRQKTVKPVLDQSNGCGYYLRASTVGASTVSKYRFHQQNRKYCRNFKLLQNLVNTVNSMHSLEDWKSFQSCFVRIEVCPWTDLWRVEKTINLCLHKLLWGNRRSFHQESFPPKMNQPPTKKIGWFSRYHPPSLLVIWEYFWAKYN